MLKFIKKTKIINGCIFGTIATLCCAGIVVVGSSKNASAVVDTIVGELDTSCTVLSSTTNPAHTATVTPGETVSNIGNTSVNVKCNDANGFSVFAVGNSGDVYGNNILSHQTETSTTIAAGDPPSSGTASSSYWAMKVTPASDRSEITSENSFDNYKAVPSSWTKVVKRAAGVEAGTSSTFSVTYQVFATATQIAGTYTGQVTFTVANPSTEECPDGYEMEDGVCKASACGSTKTMQSIDSTYISSMTTGTQEQMCDSRDGKTYYVAKLADGKVWMTQNLDYDLVAGTTLTSSDSDVESDWEIDASTYTATGTWNYSYDASESYNPGDNSVYLITSGSTSNDTSYSSLSACTAAGNSEEACQHGHQGNYYNWYAATAGSNANEMENGDEAPQSICPAGWRLPYGTQANKSWYYMLSNSISGYGSNAATSQAMRTAPFYILRAGVYYGSVNYVGSYGFYWSSTANGSVFAYGLYFDSSYVDLQLGGDASNGFSVRCVAR